VGKTELVEVVNVCNAEVKRRDEDDLVAGESGEDVKWDDQSAPNQFFTDRPLEVVRLALNSAE